MILGGGFGGLNTCLALRREAVTITLIDRSNHHVFQPLLYQVATAALSAPDIAAPLRRILRSQRNVTVLLDEARKIDVARRRVHLSSTTIDYDYLVVATGAMHTYFGHDEWGRHAPGLKTLADALEIRRRVLLAYECAEREPDAKARAPFLTFVVIGGGPTGVELAGALAEIASHTLARDFRNFDPRRARVILLEGSAQILPSYPTSLARSAQTQLERLGVDVRVGAMVTDVDARGVCVGDERIATRTALWAAGVAASPLATSLGAPLDHAGRVEVRADLTLPTSDHVFVIGDLATVECDGKPVPGVAPAAIQAGRHTARNIRRAIRGETLEPFRYVDKGSLATIGRSAGVAVIGRLRLSGFVAWAAWLLVHVFFLIGFRNRAVVLFDWAWAYVTYQRSARVILDEPRSARESDPG